MLQVLDSAFVEHDAYILFDKLMTFGKSWYEFNNDVPNRKATNSNTKVFMSIYEFVNYYSNYWISLTFYRIIYPSLQM